MQCIERKQMFVNGCAGLGRGDVSPFSSRAEYRPVVSNKKI